MLQIKQLTRKPIKTILGVLLVLLASAMLCVSLSQFLSLVWTRDSVESQYSTIALPTNKYKITRETDEDGRTTVIYSDSQPPEVQKLLSELPEQLPEAIAVEEYHSYISAFCGGMEPLNWAEFYTGSAVNEHTDGTTILSVTPYSCAMLVVRASEVSAPYPYGTLDLPPELAALSDLVVSDPGYAIDVTGTVEQAYLFQKGFDSPEGYTVHVTVRCETEEMAANLGLREGERYLVYGMDYTDWNWELKKKVGTLAQGAYERCAWENIRRFSQKEINSLPVNDPEEMAKTGTAEKMIALYTDPESGKGRYLNQTELAMAESCSLTAVCSPCVYANSIDGKIEQFNTQTGTTDTITNEAFNSMYASAGIARLSGSVEDFLEREENELWRETANVIRINNHAFPVVATDNLMSIAPFGLQEAFLSEGRLLTEKDYEDGAAVCLISETLAVRSGLNVGDTIPLRFYEMDAYLPGGTFSLKSANPEAAFFSTKQGFSSEEMQFTIVGLYRQKQEWSSGLYSFTPNTVFVPKASVIGQMTTADSGLFYFLLLKNGAADAVETYLAENGYEGLLAYYDQGYSDISDNLTEFYTVSVRIVLIGVLGWAVCLAVFLFLFPAQQRTEAERMWTLGAAKGWVLREYQIRAITIALPGTVLGGVLSSLLLQTVFRKLTAQAGVTLNLAQTPLMLAGLLAVQLLVIAGMVYLIVYTEIRRLYRENKGAR